LKTINQINKERKEERKIKKKLREWRNSWIRSSLNLFSNQIRKFLHLSSLFVLSSQTRIPFFFPHPWLSLSETLYFCFRLILFGYQSSTPPIVSEHSRFAWNMYVCYVSSILRPSPQSKAKIEHRTQKKIRTLLFGGHIKKMGRKGNFFLLTRVNSSDPWLDHLTWSIIGSGFKTMLGKLRLGSWGSVSLWNKWTVFTQPKYFIGFLWVQDPNTIKGMFSISLYIYNLPHLLKTNQILKANFK
jgi:hypothetical protein